MNRYLSLLFITLFTYALSHNASPLNLTPDELNFIKQHPKILLGTGDEWIPYATKDSDGNTRGYDQDVLTLINTLSGANFELITGDWGEMQVRAKRGEIDGLSTGAASKTRREYLNLSDTYISLQKMLITTKENPKNITKIEDLKGKTIAIDKSNLTDVQLSKEFPESTIILHTNPTNVIKSVVTGEADAMFGNGSTLYLANEIGLPFIQNKLYLDRRLDLVFGVRRDWPEAISIINKSLKSIGRLELLKLKKKWFFSEYKDSCKTKIFLSPDEALYLSKKKSITMCVDPDRMPYESIRNSKHEGIAADFIELFSERIGTPITLVETKSWSQSLQKIAHRECDILSLAQETQESLEYLDFTTPYLDISLALATKIGNPFIDKLSQIGDKTIGIVRDYSIIKELRSRYPTINIIEVDSTLHGLEMVDDGEIHGYMDSSSVINRAIGTNYATRLAISGMFDTRLLLGVATRNDEKILHGIFEKAVQSLDSEREEEITQRWLQVDHIAYTDYRLIWQIVIFASLVLVGFLFWNFKLKQEIDKRVQAEEDLRELNSRLELKIAEEMEEVQKKENLLQSQARLAQMGEMLSMIAHQWRQPLGAIASAIIAMKLRLTTKKVNFDKRDDLDAYLLSTMKKYDDISGYVQFLSATIDDFKNFFKADKYVESVTLTQLIEKTLNIIKTSIENRGILLTTDYQTNHKLEVYSNELMQVILNIIKNSEDNLIERAQKDGFIAISSFREQDRLVISIRDNGGGIPVAILEKIFDPYFSTKNAKNGTGLGLYMSKTIVEEHHGGELKVTNKDSGADFRIYLPLSNKKVK